MCSCLLMLRSCSVKQTSPEQEGSRLGRTNGNNKSKKRSTKRQKDTRQEGKACMQGMIRLPLLISTGMGMDESCRLPGALESHHWITVLVRWEVRRSMIRGRGSTRTCPKELKDSLSTPRSDLASWIVFESWILVLRLSLNSIHSNHSIRSIRSITDKPPNYSDNGVVDDLILQRMGSAAVRS